MKRTLLTLGLITLMFSGSAVVGGPKPGEGEMAITGSGSSASATTSAGPNGTEFTSKIEMAGKNPNTSMKEEIQNKTYEGNKVKFESHIFAPNPCYVIEQETEETGEDRYRITIQTVKDQLDNQTLCTQQTVMIKYEGSFEAEKPYTLEIRHGNQTIETMKSQDTSKPDPKDERNQRSTSRIMSWLRSLF